MKLFKCYVILCLVIISNGYDVGGIISGNRMGGVPLGRGVGYGELDVEGVCSYPGFTCQNCTHAVTCVELPVGWLKVPLQECPADQSCNAHKKSCSKEAVPECDVTALKYQHVCEQVGIFPDAFDCRKFHLCSPSAVAPDGRPADHRAAFCPRHYGYDPHTAQCSVKLTNSQCETTPVPSCEQTGQSDVVAGSPNHYYVCLSRDGALHPQIFICPHGWFYYDGFCRPEPKTVNNNDSTQENAHKINTTQENVDKINTTSIKIDKNDALKVIGVKTDVKEKKGKSLDDNEVKEVKTTTTTEHIESFQGMGFFSTDPPSTYATDTFLADRYDFSHLETDDGNSQNFGNYFEVENSFESEMGIID